MRRVTPLLLVLLSIQALAQGPMMLHFKPQNHLLGDVHPFFHDGACHLYYLKPGKYESAVAWSEDWLQWAEKPLSHAPTAEGDWMSPYFVLGVFRDTSSSVFRSFYGHAKGRMVSSVSIDLSDWSCAPKEFHIPPADYYERRRDPFVFWIPEIKAYGCVMTTWMKGRPKEKGGAVSLATSPDLKAWKDHGPVLDPGDIGEPECPQMFQLDGRWYLLASIYDRAVGKPVYWMASSPFGPWPKETTGALDGKDLCAAQMAFEDETPFLFGWIPLEPAKQGRQTWGGHLAMPREIYKLTDGHLATRLPAKLVKAFVGLQWKQLANEAPSGDARRLAGSDRNFALEFTWHPATVEAGMHLSFLPLGEVVFSRDRLRIFDGRGECWSELPVQLQPDTDMPVSIFVEDNIVEVFVANRYSLAARVPRSDSNLELRTQPPAALVSHERLAPLRMAK